jgi:hypothetical protein
LEGIAKDSIPRIDRAICGGRGMLHGAVLIFQVGPLNAGMIVIVIVVIVIVVATGTVLTPRIQQILHFNWIHVRRNANVQTALGDWRDAIV